jgi:hypothetical protein
MFVEPFAKIGTLPGLLKVSWSWLRFQVGQIRWHSRLQQFLRADVLAFELVLLLSNMAFRRSPGRLRLKLPNVSVLSA